ncbi:ABC1 family-domain-containing protein [Baffinella frigidus]|nr:ABC1 family-domain-containing protein [Cryptophyta sp. CCMP2293]
MAARAVRGAWRFASSPWSLPVVLVAAHQYDTHFKYARFNRNLRSVYAAVETLYDYKVALARTKDLDALHEKVAKRWFDELAAPFSAAPGLYIKIGQQVATMNHILPAPFLKYFSQMNDQAPCVDMSVVTRVIKGEFGGKGPHEVFLDFEETAIASASIAQVHRARLQDGTRVAVKVQKPEIAVQMPWDLLCFRFLVFSFEKIFDLPMYWTCDAVCDAVRQEVDFRIEAQNALLAKEDLERDGSGRFYVPLVHSDHSTKKVLSMEWIDGIRICDLSELEAARFDTAKVAQMMVEAFSHQIFLSGWIHADPHPGNMLVRRKPEKVGGSAGGRGGGATQLVILDHGMYVNCSETFRKDYCNLWKAMVLLDTVRVESICRSWGIRDANFFASLQLLKPFSPSTNNAVHLNATTKAEVYQMQIDAYARVKELLMTSASAAGGCRSRGAWGAGSNPLVTSKGLGQHASSDVRGWWSTGVRAALLAETDRQWVDSQQVPSELIMLGRNLNIVRANNKGMRSPVNRVSIMAWHAARGASSSSPSCYAEHAEERAAWCLRKDALQPPPPYAAATPEAPHQQGVAPGLLVKGGGGGGGRGGLFAAAAAPLEPLAKLFDWEMVVFRGQLALLEVAYYSAHFWRLANSLFFGRDTGGFEELLEQSVSNTVEAQLGFKLNFDEGVEKCFG